MNYNPFLIFCARCAEVQNHFKLHKNSVDSSVCNYVSEFTHNFSHVITVKHVKLATCKLASFVEPVEFISL